jgi:hypothetical protein
MTLLEVFSLAAVLLFTVLLLMEVTAVIIALIDCKKRRSGRKRE